MAKRKLKKFAELDTFTNVTQPNYHINKTENYIHKGKWSNTIFRNNSPIVLELGCGKGEYTNGLAAKYPEKNFIGIDIKGDRIWKGSKEALENNLTNVHYLRIPIEHINLYFDYNEIDEIWITFPDPQPKNMKANRRLTSPEFIERYKKILKKEGLIHLKTDNRPLFDYTLEVISEYKHNLLEHTHNLYDLETHHEIKSIKTYYEDKFHKQGFSICYLKFKINQQFSE